MRRDELAVDEQLVARRDLMYSRVFRRGRIIPFVAKFKRRSFNWHYCRAALMADCSGDEVRDVSFSHRCFDFQSSVGFFNSGFSYGSEK